MIAFLQATAIIGIIEMLISSVALAIYSGIHENVPLCVIMVIVGIYQFVAMIITISLIGDGDIFKKRSNDTFTDFFKRAMVEKPSDGFDRFALLEARTGCIYFWIILIIAIILGLTTTSGFIILCTIGTILLVKCIVFKFAGLIGLSIIHKITGLNKKIKLLEESLKNKGESE